MTPRMLAEAPVRARAIVTPLLYAPPMADDFWKATKPTARGHRLSATLLTIDTSDGNKLATGFAVTLQGSMLQGSGPTHHAYPDWYVSRLIVWFYISVGEAARLIEH